MINLALLTMLSAGCYSNKYLGMLTPLTAQQLRRPFGDKRTVHYGNKDTSPKEQTVRHIHVDFVDGWSIHLAQTFNSISCSETSVANRASTGHEDINCLINILKDWLVLRVSSERDIGREV